MTVPATPNTIRYSGTNTTGPFDYPYVYISDDHIQILKRPVSGDDIELVAGTDYTRTSGGPGEATGAEFTLTAVLAVGETLAITALTPAEQTTTPDQVRTFRDQGFASSLDALGIQNRRVLSSVESALVKSPLDLPGQLTLKGVNPNAALVVDPTDSNVIRADLVTTDQIANAEQNAISAAASAAAAEAAKDAAEEAAENFIPKAFFTKAEAEADEVAAASKAFFLFGYFSSVDGGGGNYKRVDAEPAHAAKIRTADRFISNGTLDPVNGGWWEKSAFNTTLNQFSAVGDGSTNNDTAVTNAIAYGRAKIDFGTYNVTALPSDTDLANTFRNGGNGHLNQPTGYTPAHNPGVKTNVNTAYPIYQIGRAGGGAKQRVLRNGGIAVGGEDSLFPHGMHWHATDTPSWSFLQPIRANEATIFTVRNTLNSVLVQTTVGTNQVTRVNGDGFTSVFVAGHYIIIGLVEYRIIAIADDDNLTVQNTDSSAVSFPATVQEDALAPYNEVFWYADIVGTTVTAVGGEFPLTIFNYDVNNALAFAEIGGTWYTFADNDPATNFANTPELIFELTSAPGDGTNVLIRQRVYRRELISLTTKPIDGPQAGGGEETFALQVRPDAAYLEHATSRTTARPVYVSSEAGEVAAHDRNNVNNPAMETWEANSSTLHNSAGGAPVYKTQFASGSQANPTAPTTSGGEVLKLSAEVYDGAAYVPTANITFATEGNFSTQKWVGIRFFTTNAAGAVVEKWRITGAGDIRPASDNAHNFGNGSFRPKEIFAANPTINTSDKQAKTLIDGIENKILDAWSDVEFCQFKWKDAVKKKGDGARWHYGAIAQQVIAAFEKHGLDPFEHGPICYDEWDDIYEDVTEEIEVLYEVTDDKGNTRTRVQMQTVPTGEKRLVKEAGSIYGLRYEECLVLEAALMRRELKQLKRRSKKQS